MNQTNLTFSETENVRNLLELMTAYQRSQVLFTFVELEITKLLTTGKLSAPDVARRRKINPLAMERFLNASVSIGLLTRKEGFYSNSEMAEALLVKGNRFYLGGQINRHRKRSSKVWAKLTGHLKNWKYGSKNPAPDESDQGAEAMTEQHNLALLHGFALAKSFDFSNYKKILDLGGGTGSTSIALCKTSANLQATVFDLPENAAIAGELVRQNNLQDQIKTAGGDFKKDDLTGDFDVVLLANFMSVADASENQKLLKELYEMLPSGGVCILSGWIMDNSHLAPQISVLFCLEDICWNAPDVERDEQIYSKWLKDAGFQNIQCKTYLEPTKMLFGYKI